MQDTHDTYSFDGHGINGRDEYRTRLLTLTDAGHEAGIGPTVARLLDDSVATYNGWKNYPTWAVNLWLSNDEPLYREALERTQDTISDPPHVSEHWDEEQTRRYNVADMFKEWVTDELAPDLGATFAADLLGYALDCVEWDEIADAWIESVTEQTERVR